MWSNLLIDGCLKGLQNHNKAFKYVVTVVIMQKTGAGLHTAATCYWDTKRDGYCKVPWENDTIHCITTVFGMAIQPSGPDTL